MRKKRFHGFHILASVVAACIATVLLMLSVVQLRVGGGALTLLSAYELIQDKFVGPYDETQVVDRALSSMVNALGDQWSYYLTAEEYEEQNLRRTNHYVGIGVTVEYTREEGLLITEVTEGGPADEAGIVAGEIITTVDGESIAGEARYNGSTMITGQEDTQVVLTLLSPDGTARTITVVRAALESQPVTSEMLEGGIGYVALANYYDGSAAMTEQAVNDLLEAGAASLIFDMRNNGGGYLTELTQLLDYILPEGPIFRSRDKAGNETVEQSDADCIEGVPMVVLVNESTYSAAEFFAAALQEQGYAVIIGDHTSGKGYAQQTYPLPGGSAMGISTSEYTTGGGASLIGTGVTLDQEVALTGEGDSQLEAAIAYLAAQP